MGYREGWSLQIAGNPVRLSLSLTWMTWVSYQKAGAWHHEPNTHLAQKWRKLKANSEEEGTAAGARCCPTEAN